MRKFKIDKDFILTDKIIIDLIKQHRDEKVRLDKLLNYYNNENEAIRNRIYDDINKPQNRLSHPYAQYITDTATGYLLGKPITYSTEEENLLEAITDIFRYNDEADNNTTLAKYASIYGYAYEIMFTDIQSNVRFRAINPQEMICVYDNTLEENLVLAIRYYSEKVNEKNITFVEAYERPIFNESGEIASNGKITRCEIEGDTVSNITTEDYYFSDIPVNVYVNNDEMYGDFEKLISLIDAYDQTQSDSANDFEYFTNCMLVISGYLVDEESKNTISTDKVINFQDSEGKAEYLIKNINDTALENYKNRLDNDIHKFSGVPNMSDESFSNNSSGVSLEYKLMSLENKLSVKEAKFKKGLMRRIELICDFLKIKAKGDFSYLAIEPIFTRNKPNNLVEVADVMTKLSGLLSEETIIGLFPNVTDIQSEIKKKKEEESAMYKDDYMDLGGGNNDV